MGLMLALVIGISQGLASPFFTPLRDDQTVPQNCVDMKLSFYSVPAEKIYMGRKGGVSMGFTMEYPVSRSNASTLWKYFKGLTHGNDVSSLKQKIMNNPELKRDYDIISRNYREQDFDFNSEGEILEVLAIEMLYDEFPSNHYYITGGVEYHEDYSPQTIGEVDLFVGFKHNCEVVAVGEVKLGTRKTLNKAKKQLLRFENFLIDHNASGFGHEYDPSKGPRNAPR